EVTLVPLGSLTLTGLPLSAVVPLPSSPCELLPHAQSVPAAAVCVLIPAADGATAWVPVGVAAAAVAALAPAAAAAVSASSIRAAAAAAMRPAVPPAAGRLL